MNKPKDPNAVALGTKGGSVTSKRKADAARINAKKAREKHAANAANAAKARAAKLKKDSEKPWDNAIDAIIKNNPGSMLAHVAASRLIRAKPAGVAKAKGVRS